MNLNKIYSIIFALSLTFVSLNSCNYSSDVPVAIKADDIHLLVEKHTESMVHDIFSPPLASRAYVYPFIAAYSVVANKRDDLLSLSNFIAHYPASIDSIVKAKNLNYDMAALMAYLNVSIKLIFSEKTLSHHRDSLYSSWKKLNKKDFIASKNYADAVSKKIIDWLEKDNYKETRTMSKFTVNTDSKKRWQPTPPAYMDAIEPHWRLLRTFLLKSPDQFKPAKHPEFSMQDKSDFYQELKEVYRIVNDIKNAGEHSDSLAIAKFWDCNPYLSVNRGHLMFAIKKITPGAHWIGICQIACKKTNASLAQTLYAYMLTSIALADAFISCWDEKYRSNLIRPETLINEYIDQQWQPILQTPPFPEYTSGHSVISGSAAVVLSHIFGHNFSFNDTSELKYGLPARKFNSFNQAAQEAAISRLYGGIHYRSAVEIGLKQGKTLGNYIWEQLPIKSNEKK